MTEKGYIKLYRQLTEWEWYKSPATVKMWLHILLTANWKPSRFMGIDVPAGGLVTSIKHLAEGSGLTEKQVRTALQHLESTHEICKKRANNATLIIVEKWRDFQDEVCEEGKRRANEGQTKGKRRATIEEDIRNKELNQSINSVCDLLTEEEWEWLDVTYDNLLGLIDLIDDRLRPNFANVKKPFQYIVKVAKEERWVAK